MPKASRQYTTSDPRPRWRPGTYSAYYEEYAAKFAAVSEAVAVLMREIRASAEYLRKYHGYSLSSFTTCTGLHKNSLLRLEDHTWVPKASSLDRLDRLIIRAEAKRRGRVFAGEVIKRGRPPGRRIS